MVDETKESVVEVHNSNIKASKMFYGKGRALKLDTEYIKLDSFLKAVNAAASGGEAKVMIGEGMVRVNGEVETRRGRKLYPGDRVEAAGKTFAVE